MEHTYRLSVSIGDYRFELESSNLEWLEKKEKEYLSAFEHKPSSRPKEQTHTPTMEPTLLPQNLTINEFYKQHVKSKDVKSRTDLVVFFVYYLNKILKRDTVKTADVAQCFADIAYPNYSKLNVTDILTKARQKALLNFVNNFWSLTITGEDFVLNTISSNPK